MDLSQFDYDLPPSLIAQEPVEPRDAARLLVLDRHRGTWSDHTFADLPALLRPGDCLVLNRSRVIPARLFAQGIGGHRVEILLLKERDPGRWEALVRPGRRLGVGARVTLAGGLASATVRAVEGDGIRVLVLESPWPVEELLARHGLPPLPPYIARYDSPKPEDRERYQTVYAEEDGSVAAPTAGLHFTSALLDRVRRNGVEVHALTLHVGPGTFRPVRATWIERHRMDAEDLSIPAATAEAVNRAHAEGRRVIAVGTTTTRALEWSTHGGSVRAGRGAADLFIRPGHRFAAIDALITNFHLPRSTLLMLVSAFAGQELTRAAYAYAIGVGYRFYSYGDAMLIL